MNQERLALNRPRLRRWPTALLVLSVLLLVLGAVSLWLYEQFDEYRFLENLNHNDLWMDLHNPVLREEIAHGVSGIPERFLHGLLHHPRLPELRLDVRPAEWQKLLRQRDHMLGRGVLEADEKEEVPAWLTHNGIARRAKIRFKGDWYDHLLFPEGWSFRVELADGAPPVLGHWRFALQHPRTRRWEVEQLFLETLKEFGIMVPDYRFVTLRLNGKNWGLMALEERFTHHLLERFERKEAPMGRFNEDALWGLRGRIGTFGPYRSTWWQTTAFEPFQPARVAKKPVLSRQAEYMGALMNAYRDGRLPPEQVFDLDALARLAVAAAPWGASHALSWRNLRFALNPYTLKLEPLTFDNGDYIPRINKTSWLREGRHHEDLSFLFRLYRFPAFREALERAMAEILPIYEKPEFQEKLAARHRQLMAAVAWENPVIPPVHPERMPANAQYIRNTGTGYFGGEKNSAEQQENYFGEENTPFIATLRLYKVPGGASEYKVVAYNMLPYEVFVKALTAHIRRSDGALVTREISREMLLPPRSSSINLLPRFAVDVVLEEGEEKLLAASARVYRKPQGFQRKKTVQYVSAREVLPYLEKPALSAPFAAEELANRHPWLGWRPEGNLLLIKPGEHRLEEPLILPEGVNLQAGPGVALTFGANAFLLARGSVRFEGTAENPITLSPLTESWPGLFVQGGDVFWRQVRVSGARGVEHGPLALDGAVTVYRGQADIAKSSFENISAEDALNLVHSRYQVKNLSFTDTASDGLDADFSQGSATGLTLARIGGDGVDIGGGHVVVAQVSATEVGDKVISVGEGALAEVAGVTAGDVNIGLAVKDGSQATARQVTLRKVRRAALATYTKKPQYGEGARLLVEGADFSGKAAVFAQEGTHLLVNGQKIPTSPVDVDALYAEETP